MITETIFQPFLAFSHMFGSRPVRKEDKKGPLPSWNNDIQLGRQLMKDTGLSPEDLSCSPSWDQKLPFFMQQRKWY